MQFLPSPLQWESIHLDQFLLGIEVWQYHIFSIRDPCQGNTQTSCCNLVAVVWQSLGQEHPNGLHHVERRVEWAQEPLPGFFGHPNNAGTSLTCNKRKTNAPWNGTKPSLLLYKTRHRKASFPAFPRGFSPLANAQLIPRGCLQGVLEKSWKFALLALTHPHHKELPPSYICFRK